MGCLISYFPLEQLRALNLSSSGVVAEFMPFVARATSLQALDISRCPHITVASLRHLSGGRAAAKPRWMPRWGLHTYTWAQVH